MDQDAVFAARKAAAEAAPVTPERVSALVSLVARAFSDDPPMRWVFREAPHHEKAISAFIDFAIREQALRHGQCYLAADGGAGAVWLPPSGLASLNVRPLRQLLMLPRMIAMTGLARFPRAIALGDAITKNHPKSPPHWYLYFLAADPAKQGMGLGSAILEATLARADAEKMPAYLDNSKEKNTRLYERHGFRIVSEFRARPDAPPLWGMWREARI
jgi:ribosomal protein S18 acetylase RimI-like enzyme